MLANILMSSCYTEYFHNEENECVKKLSHFYCHCKEEHVYFVHTCKYHPFVAKKVNGMKNKCFCAGLGHYEICDFCVQIKYLLNFRVYKFCLRAIPKNIQQHLVPLDDFLTNSLNFCGPFFSLTIRK